MIASGQNTRRLRIRRMSRCVEKATLVRKFLDLLAANKKRTQATRNRTAGVAIVDAVVGKRCGICYGSRSLQGAPHNSETARGAIPL